jgi:hypothetical protein
MMMKSKTKFKTMFIKMDPIIKPNKIDQSLLHVRDGQKVCQF